MLPATEPSDFTNNQHEPNMSRAKKRDVPISVSHPQNQTRDTHVRQMTQKTAQEFTRVCRVGGLRRIVKLHIRHRRSAPRGGKPDTPRWPRANTQLFKSETREFVT